MAFSLVQTEAKSELETILEVADKFNEIIDNTKLVAAVKRAYGLTDEEKAASNAARDLIKKAEDAVKKNQKLADSIDASNADAQKQADAAMALLEAKNIEIDAKQEKSDATLADILNNKKELSDQKKEIKTALSDLDDKKNDLDTYKASLDSVAAQLEKDRADVAAQRDAADQYEASLKSKSAQLQSLIAGM